MATKVIVKLNLLGDGAVGKTSLRNRFMGKGFRDDHLMTIGADFSLYEKKIIHNHIEYEIAFQIWDMAGQARFENLRARFFQGSMAGIMVYDITREESFHSIPRWIEEIFRHNGSGVIPLVLVGNKSDLRDKKSVPMKKGEDYAALLSKSTERYGFTVKYVEASAKDGTNIDIAFETIGHLVLDNLIRKHGSLR